MAVLYRIRNWEQHFEVAQSKRCARVSWVPLPNKHDGKSYRRLISMKNGPALYCAWVLLVQIASKCPERGVLADSDGPLCAKDFSAKTGCPDDVFEKALEALCSPEVAWMERVDDEARNSERAPSSYERAQPRVRSRTGHNRTGHNKDLPSEGCPEVASLDSGPAATADGSLERAGSPRPEGEAKAGGGLPSVPPIMVFPCVGKGPAEWPLTEAKLAEYQQSFPGVDALAECRKARQWCIDNKANRKTSGGMPAFLTRWLSRAQDQGGSYGKTRNAGPAGGSQGREQERLERNADALSRFVAAHSDIGEGLREGDCGPGGP